ncbi:lipid IV(A) 3-deoxy-D-manno-octulosonic acid transferase [uncultured Campylobacter sp.]|uniref:lipid IV(A) 3-deoxy-D-manno-octulosonic acid transferase n=1 Tax=uncultured Campylobacter sp. TaxID=218934 RepID=UPI0026127731|nr:lipid IV(A) 3-deoxy-D-manno-octulosonic acid transferase [uncultured Campylobacter sp.]
MIYNLVAAIVWVVALPILLLLSFKSKYKKSIPARFFLKDNSKLKKSDVHFHACSFGEVRALAPLFDKFKNIAITTTTQTGFNEAKRWDKEAKFLPYELFLPFWLGGSKVLVVFEAELWLNLVKYAKKNGTFIILLNARVSDHSYEKYLKFRFYYRKIFSYIDVVFAQTTKDKERLLELGAKNIIVNGNIKCYVDRSKFSQKMELKSDKKILVIASTHSGEESIILDSIATKRFKIIIAPRHPERFDEVDLISKEYCKRLNLTYEKFSQNLALKSDFILLDTLGKLDEFYQVCDVVILGGSFIRGIGGHNPIEIARYNKPLISGKYIHNQKELFNSIDGAIFAEPSELRGLLEKELPKTKIKKEYDLNPVIELIKEKI